MVDTKSQPTPEQVIAKWKARIDLILAKYDYPNNLRYRKRRKSKAKEKRMKPMPVWLL